MPSSVSQNDHGLDADGYVGQKTWDALYNGTNTPDTPDPDNPDTPDKPDTPTDPKVDVSGYPVISYGSSNSTYVKMLQEQLNQLGYRLRYGRRSLLVPAHAAL